MSIRPVSATRVALRCLAGTALAGGLSASGYAADVPTNAGQRGLLSVRQRDQNTVKALRKKSEGEECVPVRTFTLGAAYEHDQGGDHSLTTPFLFDYEQCELDLQFGGAGYTRSVSDGERSSGFADVFGGVSYKFSPGDGRWALVPSFQLTLPTHGKVGSRRASELVGLDLTYSPGKYGFSWTGAGTVNRDGETVQDASRYTTGVSGKMAYAWDDDRSASLSLGRDYRRGKGGSTTLTAIGNFPISTKVAGSLTVTHGLTSGKRDNTIELDFSFPF